MIPELLDLSSDSGLRYSTRGFETTGRDMIYLSIFDYILANPFMPNIYELMQEKGRAPHNIFLNAFVYGGLFSFISIMTLLFYQYKVVIQTIKKGCTDNNVYFFVFSFAWMSYNINCLVHNRSIVTGDFLIWLIWGVIASRLYFTKKIIRK